MFSECSVEVSRGGGAYNDFQLPEAEQRRMFDFYTVRTASVQVSSAVMDEMQSEKGQTTVVEGQTVNERENDT